MRAARLHGLRDVRIHEEERPKPGPGEALVRVLAVGLCGSDLHWFEEGGIGSNRISRPIVPGHEMAGRTENGRLVAIEPAIPCERCSLCLEGHPNLCPTIRFSGQGDDDGSMREWMACPGTPRSSPRRTERGGAGRPRGSRARAPPCRCRSRR